MLESRAVRPEQALPLTVEVRFDEVAPTYDIARVCPNNLCHLRGSPQKLGTNREQIGNKLARNTREVGRPTHTQVVEKQRRASILSGS